MRPIHDYLKEGKREVKRRRKKKKKKKKREKKTPVQWGERVLRSAW
jgi:hypothetical protein